MEIGNGNGDGAPGDLSVVWADLRSIHPLAGTALLLPAIP
jgi:hypothetical protein